MIGNIKHYKRLVILLAAGTGLLVGAGCTARVEPPATAILVRHAEKGSVPEDDPPLTADGEKRARDLIHVLGEVDVGAIYASDRLRSQETVRPLAEHLGLPVQIIGRVDITGFADAIRSQGGRATVVAGHNDTVGPIVEALGGSIEPIPHSDYDDLFVVIVPPSGPTSVIHLQYGTATVSSE